MTPPPAPTMAAHTNAVHGGRRRHVLLFPLPYQGHINPMFRLAGLLHARGFAITVFHTQFNAPDPADHPDYRFVAVLDGSPVPVVAIKDVVAQILELGVACAAAFRDHLASVLDEYSRDAVACLVADTHLLPIFEVAARLSVPTLALRTGSAACCASFLAYPMLLDKGYLPVQESQRDMPVVELPPYRVRDLPDIGEDAGGLLRELLSRAMTAVKTSSGLILNTFDALERRELEGLRRDLAVPVFDVGPLHKLISPVGDSSLLLPDRSCLEWLDAWPTGSVLYVSFGSVACMSPRDLVETAWGIAGSGVPFLWVVRSGMVHGSTDHHLPEGFKATTRERGKVVAWAPQEEVLRHSAVGGFWTHCGWNSTMESICEGVPMLCRPYFGDQMGNARYVEHVWRVGLEGDDDLERGRVEAAIHRLMTDKEGADMRTRAGELKKAAAECTGEGGSWCLAVDKLITHMSLQTSYRGLQKRQGSDVHVRVVRTASIRRTRPAAGIEDHVATNVYYKKDRADQTSRSCPAARQNLETPKPHAFRGHTLTADKLVTTIHGQPLLVVSLLVQLSKQSIGGGLVTSGCKLDDADVDGDREEDLEFGCPQASS